HEKSPLRVSARSEGATRAAGTPRFRAVLGENYRSTQAVPDAANALIGKNLRSRKKNGAKPRYVTVADGAARAQYVVTQVLAARERGVLLRRSEERRVGKEGRCRWGGGR